MLDGPTSRYEVIIKVTTEVNRRAAGRPLHDRGVDFIKKQSLIPRDAYFGLADEVKKLGMRFEGHVDVRGPRPLGHARPRRVQQRRGTNSDAERADASVFVVNGLTG